MGIAAHTSMKMRGVRVYGARRAYLYYMQINMPCGGNGAWRGKREGGYADVPAGCNNRPSPVAMVTPSIP